MLVANSIKMMFLNSIKITSWNDCLHVEPPLTPVLFDILLRFSINHVALVGDIEKALLNIEINLTDRDCLRVLWIDDSKAKNPEIVAYRYNIESFDIYKIRDASH